MWSFRRPLWFSAAVRVSANQLLMLCGCVIRRTDVKFFRTLLQVCGLFLISGCISSGTWLRWERQTDLNGKSTWGQEAFEMSQASSKAQVLNVYREKVRPSKGKEKTGKEESERIFFFPKRKLCQIVSKIVVWCKMYLCLEHIVVLSNLF